MVQKRTFSGRTLEEALEAAARTYKKPHDQIQYRILEEKATLFGLDRRITIEVLEDEALPPLRKVLNRIIVGMGLSISYDIHVRDGGLFIELRGDDLGLVLQRYGELLDAIQTLLIQVAQRNGFKGKIQLDADNYRRKVKAKLQRLARKLGQKVKAQRKCAEVDALPPHLRKIIHLEVAKTPGLTTESIGDGYLKKIIIKLDNTQG